jgi:hypothetical protein
MVTGYILVLAPGRARPAVRPRPDRTGTGPVWPVRPVRSKLVAGPTGPVKTGRRSRRSVKAGRRSGRSGQSRSAVITGRVAGLTVVWIEKNFPFDNMEYYGILWNIIKKFKLSRSESSVYLTNILLNESICLST